MTAPEDEELFLWLLDARHMGGSFVNAIATAGLTADDSNYALLRPTLLKLKDKYDSYGKDKYGQ